MTELDETLTIAIKGLTRRMIIDLEHLQTLESALSNPDCDPNFWDNTFVNNANLASKENIYSAQMVRLLTLKAMFIPDSLPTFLYWMENRQSKEQDHWETSFKFQINICEKLRPISEKAPQLATKIEEGIKLILLQLLDEPELLNSLVKLLKNKQGIWGNSFLYRMRNYLDNDLNLMPKFARLQQSNLTEELDKLELKLKSEAWNQIFKELSIFWQYNLKKEPIEKYKVWAKFFEKLKDYKLATLFYQISLNKVPISVFSKVCNFSLGINFKTTVYNTTVYREVDFLEEKLLHSRDSLEIIVSYLINFLELLDKYKYEILLIFMAVLVILNLLTMFLVRENIVNIFQIIIENQK